MSLFDSTTAAALISKMVAGSTFLAGLGLTSTEMANAVFAAEAEVARKLKVFLQPTEIFGYTPSAGEISALTGKPWFEEAPYDFDPQSLHSDRWGLLALKQTPVIRVDSIRYQYPGQPAGWTVPADWIRIDKRAGNVQIVPTGSLIGVGSFTAGLLNIMGGARTWPLMIQVRYVAGLTDALTAWPDLLPAIRSIALSELISSAMIGGSGSLSIDGMSESASYDPQKLLDHADVLLFGAKGRNGGLKTAIHGITVGFF